MKGMYELENTEFTTKDLHLAAYLKLKEAELVRIEKPTYGNGKTPSIFVFKDKYKCTDLGKLFWEKGDQVNIKDYMVIIRDLRSQVAAIPFNK